jgi:hypothetical protein
MAARYLLDTILLVYALYALERRSVTASAIPTQSSTDAQPLTT